MLNILVFIPKKEIRDETREAIFEQHGREGFNSKIAQSIQDFEYLLKQDWDVVYVQKDFRNKVSIRCNIVVEV